MNLSQDQKRMLREVVVFYRHHHMSAQNPQQKDIDIILKIKDLLHVKKFTIEGARSVISSKSSNISSAGNIDRKMISQLKNELQEILQVIKN